MRTAVVTDSTAYLPEDIKNHPDLFVIPIPVIIDGKIYNEGVDIQAADFYQVLNQSKKFPTTSQPSIGEALETYEDIASEGYDRIISIHLSSGISGFINNVIGMAPGIEDIDVRAFDSQITSMPMGHMVATTLTMLAEGYTIDAIFEKLEEIKRETQAFLIVDDLNNLVRGGRLKNGAAIIGTLLKIKPVLTFKEGEIVLSEKIRSSKKAFARCKDLLLKKEKKANQEYQYFIIHGNNYEVAAEEKEKLLAANPSIEIEIGEFGPVIGAHLGEKAIGFAWSPK